jgi:ParB family transcriptional regulator, chromosome partitioning protein
MEKRGLGRGLASLISNSMADGEPEAQVREIPIGQIKANPLQPRTVFDPVKIDELCASIQEHGVLQPVLVRRIGHEKYELLAGERRFRAATQAGLTAIPALIKECSSTQQLEIAIVENLQREDIGPMEAARAYQRMADEFGMTQEAIAKRIGKSRTAVTNTMGLLDLPQQVQESLEAGQITEGHARALKGIKDASEILLAWETVLKKGLSVRDTEKLSREIRAGAAAGDERPKHSVTTPEAPAHEWSTPGGDPNENYLAGQLQEHLKTRVTLRRGAGDTGKIEIEFYSSDDLDRIFELLLPD